MKIHLILLVTFLGAAISIFAENYNETIIDIREINLSSLTPIIFSNLSNIKDEKQRLIQLQTHYNELITPIEEKVTILNQKIQENERNMSIQKTEWETHSEYLQKIEKIKQNIQYQQSTITRLIKQKKALQQEFYTKENAIYFSPEKFLNNLKIKVDKVYIISNDFSLQYNAEEKNFSISVKSFAKATAQFSNKNEYFDRIRYEVAYNTSSYYQSKIFQSIADAKSFKNDTHELLFHAQNCPVSFSIMGEWDDRVTKRKFNYTKVIPKIAMDVLTHIINKKIHGDGYEHNSNVSLDDEDNYRYEVVKEGTYHRTLIVTLHLNQADSVEIIY